MSSPASVPRPTPAARPMCAKCVCARAGSRAWSPARPTANRSRTSPARRRVRRCARPCSTASHRPRSRPARHRDRGAPPGGCRKRAQAPRLFCRILKLERAVGAINTEDAARRLARVILSDVELYYRERPKQGETLEAQIEEGRRLFASRVSPELLPIFGMVLSDRARSSVNPPATAEPPSTPASTAAAPGLEDASPASNPTIEDLPTPAPSIAVHSVEDQPTPAPAIEDQSTPAPALEDQSTPAPAFAAPRHLDQPALTARVPTTPLAPETPAVHAQARPAAPPAHEIPIPVLTARFSIPRLLAIVSVVAATVAVLYRFLP